MCKVIFMSNPTTVLRLCCVVVGFVTIKSLSCNWLFPFFVGQMITFDKRQPFTKDDLLKEEKLDGRRPLTEEDLSLKMTFPDRLPFIEDI